jgi:predicted RNA-binding protein (virulence factor B family)
MIQIGRFNELKVLEVTDSGIYLEAGPGDEILLPDPPESLHCEIGQMLEVFVCYDSEDNLIATTEAPLAQVGEFAHLTVAALEPVGAFLDWGLPKDLFLPYSEQTRDLQAGQDVIVYVYLDNSQRISASMRLERHLDKTPGNYKEGQSVELFIMSKTDLGFKAIINGRHVGVLYSNEVFQPLEHGQRLPGVIKKVREDGKIDLSLQKLGHKAAEDIGPKILELLKAKGGFLPYDDKTSAEIIYEVFGVSKKKYKMALGGLYKQRLITIDPDGIRLKA